MFYSYKHINYQFASSVHNDILNFNNSVGIHFWWIILINKNKKKG